MISSLFTKVFFLFLFTMPLQTEKEYAKEYYETGVLKAEGWIDSHQKEGYWKYYHSNGAVQKKGHYHKGEKHGYWYFYSRENRLLREGHFNDGEKQDWWIFHNNNTALKVQYKKGKREGYGLVYQKNKLQKALKYEQDKKVGEWSSVLSFRIDNPQVQF